MDERALIFQNLLNGVPVWQVARDFHRTAPDIDGIFAFVGRKLKSYCFERRMPPVFCDSIAEAQKSRVRLMELLPKLNLSKDPKFAKVYHERVTPENVMEVNRFAR